MGAERWQAFAGARCFTSRTTPDSAPPAKAGKSGLRTGPYPPFTVAVARRSSLPQPTRPPRAAVSTDLTTT